jgi:hypothetical protein
MFIFISSKKKKKKTSQKYLRLTFDPLSENCGLAKLKLTTTANRHQISSVGCDSTLLESQHSGSGGRKIASLKPA